MFRLLRSISGCHLRSSLYAALSMGSGVAWVGLLLMLMGGPTHDTSIASLLFFGAGSGLAVGLLMSRFYRADDWLCTIYSAPLAYWLGVLFFIALGNVFNDDYLLLLGAPVLATYAMFPPYLFLILIAMINGLLLRQVLCYGTNERSE